MRQVGELFQSADWNKEKHVPVIECADKLKVNEFFPVKVNLEKEIAHPNTTDQHSCWISACFHPKGKRFAYRVGHFELSAHGESVEGPDKSSIYAHHETSLSMR